MGKILDLVKKHYGNGDSFDYRDFSFKTRLNDKVSAMILKKLANSKRIGSYTRGNGMYVTIIYFYWDLETANKNVEKENKIIDKYNLKQKKLKFHET